MSFDVCLCCLGEVDAAHVRRSVDTTPTPHRFVRPQVPALFTALLRVFPIAKWYVKPDMDAFVDLQMFNVLLHHWQHWKVHAWVHCSLVPHYGIQ